MPTTVTEKLQLAVEPLRSAALHVTVVVPTENEEPDAGEQVTAAPGQLSTTAGGWKVTLGAHWPGGALTVTLAGQISVMPCTFLTVTVKAQVAVAPPESVAMQLTVVTPAGNRLPEAGVQITVGFGQLSATNGIGKLTLAPHDPGSFA